jgi:trehalose 6-phosphate synthase/phosphatase
MPRNLLIVSNRLPVNITREDDRLTFTKSIGGLATGLAPLQKFYHSKWIGWPGIIPDNDSDEIRFIKTKLISEFNCYPVFLTKKEVAQHYNGFCNNTLWPHFHYFSQYTLFNNNFWEIYKKVNHHYCKIVRENMTSDDIIWIHDYHLMLLPQLVRAKSPDVSIAFFLHTPFPSYELFRMLPWRKEILNGILGADLIGFHTYDYVRHFLSSVYRLLGLEPKFGQFDVEDRRVKVDIFPMGIHYDKFFRIREDPEVKKAIIALRDQMGTRKLIFSIDRLDYTKGIPQRLKAFNLFLDNHPEFKNKVTYVCVAVPSRTKVKKYQALKRQIDELIGHINGKHGEIGWTPIWYLYRQLPFHELAAFYNAADVALITPFRDGMNLIAKEFIASKRDGLGVLILSEGAGAAKELGEALIVNPNDIYDISEAIYKSLIISENDQIRRNRRMQARLQRYNIVHWASEFIKSLESVKQIQNELLTKDLSESGKQRLISDYHNTKSRLLFLDYDGSLREFFDNPDDARPTDEIIEILQKLINDPKNQLVLISGRKKTDLTTWFKQLKIDMVAEHGVWLKEYPADWKIIEPLKTDWKEEVRPILELFSDRTPGSFIEEKEYSLAWHYRMVDTEMGVWRARDLVKLLVDLTANFRIQILEGNKVIEVKNSGINKGRAALVWLEKKSYDFVLAAGDDWTDENIFEVLPEKGYSIKIGSTTTHAKYRLKNPRELRTLLKRIIQGS